MHNSRASCLEMSFRRQASQTTELRGLPATHGCCSGSQLTPQVNDRLFRRRSCLETGVNKHKGATERARKGVAVLIEQRVLPTLTSFILLPFQPFTPSLAIFPFFFLLLTVITPALPSIARGVAGQNHLLIWICRERAEEDYSPTVSVETLGCKQPAPVCPPWDEGVRKPHTGELRCVLSETIHF